MWCTLPVMRMVELSNVFYLLRLSVECVLNKYCSLFFLYLLRASLSKSWLICEVTEALTPCSVPADAGDFIWGIHTLAQVVLWRGHCAGTPAACTLVFCTLLSMQGQRTWVRRDQKTPKKHYKFHEIKVSLHFKKLKLKKTLKQLNFLIPWVLLIFLCSL